MTPSQVGGVGLGATAGGGILSAFGSISSGIANKNMYDYQASVARLNQQIDNQNAEFASETGKQQSAISGMKTGQQIAQTKVAQASAGFDVNSGSNAQVRESEHRVGQIDSDIIRSNAAKTAYSYQVQGAMAGAQANLYEMAGSNAMTAGLVGAGGSILGAAGSVSSQWLQGQRVGLWGGGDGGGVTAPSFFSGSLLNYGA